MKPCRIRALERAKRYVGTKEHPPYSNRGPNIDRWQRWANGMVGYPWCAAFLCGMVREACGLIVPTPLRASVEYLERWAEKVGSVLKPGTLPRRGDWICYDWDRNDWSDHIGAIDKVLAIKWSRRNFVGYVRTVEGNTSLDNNSNGGQVMVRWRHLDDKCKFIRLDAKKLVRVNEV